MTGRLSAWGAGALIAVAVAQSAGATVPARNGRLAFAAEVKLPKGVASAIYSIGVDGKGLRRVSSQVGWLDGPSWAPDGSQLVVAVRLRLYRMRPDGTHVRRVPVSASIADLGGYTDSVLTAETPAWLPDGSGITFAYGGNERYSNAGIGLFSVSYEGGEAKKIVNLENLSVDYPAGLDWSADGRRLAFGGHVVGDEAGEIFVKQVGSKARVITHPPQGADDGYPSWSPDGRSIAFVRSRGTTAGDIMVVGANGKGERALPHPKDVNPGTPSWSPDGRYIAYAAEQTRQIHVVDVQASTEQVLTVPGVKTVRRVAWQPLKG